MWMITHLGRWGSQCVERYVADSRATMAASSSSIATQALSMDREDVEERHREDREEWEAKLQALQAELIAIRAADYDAAADVRVLISSQVKAQLREELEAVQPEWLRTLREEAVVASPEMVASCTPWVVNNDTGRCHRVPESCRTLPPKSWRTACGWHFGLASFSWCTTEKGPLCRRPGCKGAAAPRLSSSSDSSS